MRTMGYMPTEMELLEIVQQIKMRSKHYYSLLLPKNRNISLAVFCFVSELITVLISLPSFSL